MSEIDSTETIEVEYRDIPGHPGYRVGNDGTVRSAWYRGCKTGIHGHSWGIGDKWNQINCSKDKNGYQYFTANKKKLFVHRIVLSVFVGPRQHHKMMARHLNGDVSDNKLANLAWGTCKENKADSIRHGTSARGERSGVSKLTEKQVIEIRKSYEIDGETQASIAIRYGVVNQLISAIINRKIWAHVS